MLKTPHGAPKARCQKKNGGVTQRGCHTDPTATPRGSPGGKEFKPTPIIVRGMQGRASRRVTVRPRDARPRGGGGRSLPRGGREGEDGEGRGASGGGNSAQEEGDDDDDDDDNDGERGW